ncbi:MAG: hypothetical protein KDC10_08265 [Calditrichaeota bacterium]|nr:hypothetical protein [Calditrichota bacterium]MCB9474389.1 hypothetical protein [Candidatus Delongbacteria bacterium]
MRVPFVLPALLGLSLIFASCQSRDSFRVGLVFTSDTKGYIEDCGCHSKRLGGMARRGAAVDSLRKSMDGNVLVFDTGNLHGTKVDADTDADGEFLVELLDHQGYDLTVLGAKDLTLEGDGLSRMVTHARHPWVGTDVADSLRPVGVQDFVIKKVDGVKVGLFSWLDPDSRANGVNAASLKNNLESMAAQLRKKVDLLVLVAYTTEDQLDALAQRVPMVDVVVLGGLANPMKREKVIGTTLVGAAGDRGRHVASFDLTLDRQRKIAQSRYSVIEIVQDYPREPWAAARMDSLKNVREEAKLARIDALRLERLASMGIDPATHASPAEGLSYLGESSCRDCHATIAAAWRMTPHAQAYAQLYRDKQMDIPEKERRATTGFLEPRGFVSRIDTPSLINVQCEACHGAGSAHVQSEGKALETLKNASESCATCHSGEHAKGFDLKRALSQVHDTTQVQQTQKPRPSGLLKGAAVR